MRNRKSSISLTVHWPRMTIRCAKSLRLRPPAKKSPRRNHHRRLRRITPKKINAQTDRTSARTTITPEKGPDPKIIGNGPIKITAPPLSPTVPPFKMGPRFIRSTPTKIITKAKKNNIPVTGNDVRPIADIGWLLQFAHHHRLVSKHSRQAMRPQLWHTNDAFRVPQKAHRVIYLNQ